MIWGCFFWHGVGPLFKIDGIMDQLVYKKILEDVMEPCSDDNLQLNWIKMHDNDPKHKSKSVTKWIADKKNTGFRLTSSKSRLKPY